MFPVLLIVAHHAYATTNVTDPFTAQKRRLRGGNFVAPSDAGSGSEKIPVATKIMETFSSTDFIAFIKLFTTEFPERYGNGPNGMRASNWLAKRWAGFAEGISWAEVKEDKISGAKQNNVVLTLTGRTDKHIVLGAHMDSTKPDSHKVKPAAWDNAAGSSIIDALAQATLAMKIQPENNVHLVLYGAEEMGSLGSKQMAKEFKAAGKQVLAVLNYDMAGSPLGNAPDERNASVDQLVEETSLALLP